MNKACILCRATVTHSSRIRHCAPTLPREAPLHLSFCSCNHLVNPPEQKKCAKHDGLCEHSDSKRMFTVVYYVDCRYSKVESQFREWSCWVQSLGRPTGLVLNMSRFNISSLMDTPLFQAYLKKKRMPCDNSKSSGNPFVRAPTGTQRKKNALKIFLLS